MTNKTALDEYYDDLEESGWVHFDEADECQGTLVSLAGCAFLGLLVMVMSIVLLAALLVRLL